MNVQGDMPFIPHQLVEELIEFSLSGAGTGYGLTTAAIRQSPPTRGAVRVVVDRHDSLAIAFARPPIPTPMARLGRLLEHMGLYAFRWESLQRFTTLPTSRDEEFWGLEQLRVRESIGVMETTIDCGLEINTPEDLLGVKG